MIKIENCKEFKSISIEESKRNYRYIQDILMKNKVYMLLEVISAIFIFFESWILIFEKIRYIELCYIAVFISICSYICFTILREKTIIDKYSIETIDNCYIANTNNIFGDTIVNINTPLNSKAELRVNNKTLNFSKIHCNITKFKQGDKWKYILFIINSNKIYEVIQ